MTLEGKLFLASVCLFAIMIVIAIIGERSLVLFDGDRALAARANKTGFTLLAGASFALAMPALLGFAATRLRAMFAKTQAQGGMANFVNGESFSGVMQLTGYLLLALFLAATCVVAFLIWTGRS